MPFVLVAIGALMLAVILAGVDRAVTGERRPPSDERADGEADEPDGPAKGL